VRSNSRIASGSYVGATSNVELASLQLCRYRDYISDMPVNTLRRVALFVQAWLCLGVARVSAQFPTFENCCSAPGVTCDFVRKGHSDSNRAKNYVDSVTFDGPVALTGRELQRAVASLKADEFERDPDWLDKVQDSLLQPWLEQGYLKAKVTARAAPVGGDDGRYAITAHVDEGLQYRLGRIDFRADPGTNYETVDIWTDGRIALRRHLPGASDKTPDPYHSLFPPEELRALIPLHDGEILSAKKIREGIDALNKLYGQHGFIDFVAQPITHADDVHQIYSIRMDLVEGNQYRIDKIEVYGLDANTQDALVWNIKTGDILDYDLVEEFFDNNKSAFPAGSYWAEDPGIIRHAKIATADITYRFRSCAGKSIGVMRDDQ